MTVVQASELEYFGVAADSKPAAAATRATFYETDSGRTFIYTGSAWVRYVKPADVGARSRFIAQLLGILGSSALRIWLPDGTDTTTSTDKTKNQATLTHNATLAGRLRRQGNGWAASFDGSTHFSYFPDAADLSFGDGSLDNGFSVVMLVKITNTANTRTLFGKFTTNQREYRAYVSTTDLVVFETYDQSASATERATSDAAVPQDALALLTFTYDGSEDSDGFIIYVNGVAVASTKASDSGGTYTAMENLTSVLGIGTGTNLASLPFQGEIAAFTISSGALTADQIWQLRNAFDGYFDFLG